MIFTIDQVMYHVVTTTTWVYPNRLKNFIPRLGDMHLLMNFVVAVGTLMAEYGLELIMFAGFGGVKKMCIGKSYPQNLGALHIVAENILQKLPNTDKNQSYI